MQPQPVIPAVVLLLCYTLYYTAAHAAAYLDGMVHSQGISSLHRQSSNQRSLRTLHAL
jgi:hypothetical protein